MYFEKIIEIDSEKEEEPFEKISKRAVLYLLYQ